jgi:hypothetical protein
MLNDREPEVGWDGRKVKEDLDEFVLRRHRIAHSGDLRPGASVTEPIRREYVVQAAKVVRAVGDAVEFLAANRNPWATLPPGERLRWSSRVIARVSAPRLLLLPARLR